MPLVGLNEEKNQGWRIFIYGKPGVGKTYLGKFLKGKTFLLSFDKSYTRLKNTIYKDGNSIWDLDPDNVQKDLADFAIWWKDANKKYDNLIIDNITSLQDLWFVEKARESKNGLDNQIAHYNEYSNYLIRFIASMLNYNLNILITAWETQRDIVIDSGQQISQYAPSMRDKARDWLMGHCDIVGRLIQKPSTGERGVILLGNDGIYAKNRMDNRKGCKVEELFDFNTVENAIIKVKTGTKEKGK